MSYMTIFSQEKHHFSLCSYFHAHPTTLLLKILGGINAWAVPPPQIVWGTVPPVPLGLRPCISQRRTARETYRRFCNKCLLSNKSCRSKMYKERQNYFPLARLLSSFLIKFAGLMKRNSACSCGIQSRG